MKTSTAIPIQLNRVYLPYLGLLEAYEKSKHHIVVFVDVTSFEFLMEALVAHSASQIAVQSCGERIDNKLLNRLPRVLHKRIKFINDNRDMQRLASTVFYPVFEEFHIELRNASVYGIGVWQIPEGPLQETLKNVIDKVIYSWDKLCTFLLGLKYKLEVDIDIEHFRKSVSTIRQESRNPEGRANMSILEGILGCYRLGEVEGLHIASHALKEQKESFIRFLEDSDYEELSRANFGLGFPPNFEKYSTRIRQLVRRIVSNDMFSSVFEACSKSLMMATRVPVPSSDLVKTLVPSSYLPPIVSLGPVLHQAIEVRKHSMGYETAAERFKQSKDTLEPR